MSGYITLPEFIGLASLACLGWALWETRDAGTYDPAKILATWFGAFMVFGLFALFLGILLLGSVPGLTDKAVISVAFGVVAGASLWFCRGLWNRNRLALRGAWLLVPLAFWDGISRVYDDYLVVDISDPENIRLTLMSFGIGAILIFLLRELNRDVSG